MIFLTPRLPIPLAVVCFSKKQQRSWKLKKILSVAIALILIAPAARGVVNPDCDFMTLADCNNTQNYAWVTIPGKNYVGYCGMTADYDLCDCIRDTSKCSQYKCNYEYYGTGKSCTACPNGGTSPAGSTSITQCYIPAGTAFSDTTGNGTYTGNCNYKN